jgi:hypothetical protein
VLPCPCKANWRHEVARIREWDPQLSLGAVYDGAPGVPAWEELGRRVRSRPEAFSERKFAERLRLLLPPSLSLPVPLIRAGRR